jgi:hypothetical protein
MHDIVINLNAAQTTCIIAGVFVFAAGRHWLRHGCLAIWRRCPACEDKRAHRQPPA